MNVNDCGDRDRPPSWVKVSYENAHVHAHARDCGRHVNANAPAPGVNRFR